MAILELLSRQRKQRVGTADDLLAAAARDHAAGKEVDLADVDRALHEIGMPVEHFATLVEVATIRRNAGAALEKLGLAQTKQRRVAASIEAETKKYEEVRKAYLDRMAALEAERKAIDEVVAKAQQARETLLVPANVLGSVRQRYEDALADRQQASATVERLRRELRQHRDRLKEAGRWIESITRSVDREITPVGIVKQPSRLPASVIRQLEAPELDKKRAQRRIDETEPQLREAEDKLDRAERAVVAIEMEILRN